MVLITQRRQKKLKVFKHSLPCINIMKWTSLSSPSKNRCRLFAPIRKLQRFVLIVNQHITIVVDRCGFEYSSDDLSVPFWDPEVDFSVV